MASNFESSWGWINPHGMKHQNNINTNPCPCSIHVPCSLFGILYASGWITLPRVFHGVSHWNHTKSSDSRAPSLGALDRRFPLNCVEEHAKWTQNASKLQIVDQVTVAELVLDYDLVPCAQCDEEGPSWPASQSFRLRRINGLQSKLQWRLLSFDEIHRSLNVGLPPSRASSILLQEIRHLAWKTDEPIPT